MGEARERRKEEARRQIYGWMGLAMFGCHCGERPPEDYKGAWITTHVAKAHRGLYLAQRYAKEKYVFALRER